MTLPHGKVVGSEFNRVNGAVRLSLVVPSEPGLPYGMCPRLILMHLTTKALIHRERTFHLGESENLSVLAEAGAKVNSSDLRGWRPLQMAAGHESPENIAALLDAGADPEIEDRDGEGPE